MGSKYIEYVHYGNYSLQNRAFITFSKQKKRLTLCYVNGFKFYQGISKNTVNTNRATNDLHFDYLYKLTFI